MPNNKKDFQICSNCGHSFGAVCSDCGCEFGCGILAEECLNEGCLEEIISEPKHYAGLTKEKPRKVTK